MKFVSEKQALERLRKLGRDFAERIAEGFEHKAAPCSSCASPGACCLDAHFVNVRISRLEARSIANALGSLSDALRARVYRRIDRVIEDHKLEASEAFSEQKFACPLFEKGLGCLVHSTAKPVACIIHACYEDPADLPPDELQFDQECRIDRLSELTYGRSEPWLPLPVAIRRHTRPGTR